MADYVSRDDARERSHIMIATRPALITLGESSDAPFLVPREEGRKLKWSSSRVRVLVVDDHKLIADSLSEILNNAGFEAMAAYDGMEALEAMSGFCPQWVLSDILMPQMNGVELGIAVRRRYPAAEVLLFSGQAGVSEILQDAQRRGYEFELLAKPIHPDKLIERLSER